MFGVNPAQIKAIQAANAKKTTQKSSTPSTKKKSSKIVTTKGTTLPTVVVTSRQKLPRLQNIEIIPAERKTISTAPSIIPSRVSPIQIINAPTLAKGNFSSFLQIAANKSISIGKDCQIQIQKGITKADTVSQIDLCNLVSYFLNKANNTRNYIKIVLETFLAQNCRTLFNFYRLKITSEKVVYSSGMLTTFFYSLILFLN